MPRAWKIPSKGCAPPSPPLFGGSALFPVPPPGPNRPPTTEFLLAMSWVYKCLGDKSLKKTAYKRACVLSTDHSKQMSTKMFLRDIETHCIIACDLCVPLPEWSKPMCVCGLPGWKPWWDLRASSYVHTSKGQWGFNRSTSRSSYGLVKFWTKSEMADGFLTDGVFSGQSSTKGIWKECRIQSGSREISWIQPRLRCCWPPSTQTRLPCKGQYVCDFKRR